MSRTSASPPTFRSPARWPRYAALAAVSIAMLTAAISFGGIGGETQRIEENPTPAGTVFPDPHWTFARPEDVGLSTARLGRLSWRLGGQGAVVRHGYMVHTWGEQDEPLDVASGAKAVLSTLLLIALEEGRLESVDERVADYADCLNKLNPDLDHKDLGITFRHLAYQISGYATTDPPGTAFNYGHRQTNLFARTLLLNVFDAGSWEKVDEVVLYPRLGDVLGFEDEATLLAFGPDDRPGRLAISVRDLARVGLLLLREGDWNGTQVLSRELARKAVTSPLPASFPRTAGHEAEICGEPVLPDEALDNENMMDHEGGYSWMWWVNGIDETGSRLWPDAPADTYLACGHHNCMRALVVIPSLDMVVVWNDTWLAVPDLFSPEVINHTRLNAKLQRLVAAAGTWVPEDEA